MDSIYFVYPFPWTSLHAEISGKTEIVVQEDSGAWKFAPKILQPVASNLRQDILIKKYAHNIVLGIVVNALQYSIVIGIRNEVQISLLTF